MKKLAITLLAGLTLCSCKKNKTEETETGPSKKLYLMTNQYSTTGSKDIIKYFVNNVPTTLGDGATVSLYGEDMEVSGNDVYVLANKLVVSTSTTSLVLYKNGVEIQSIPYTGSFAPNCLYVSGNDIYLAGAGTDAGAVGRKLKLWKNGTITEITNGSATDAIAYDLLVNGSDVYIAGYETSTITGAKIAKYWKNGTATAFTSGAQGTESEVHRIILNGNDVYCSGMISNKATIWKNGTATQLNTNDATCFGVTVSGTDVYAAGAVNNGTVIKAAYWKNSIQTNLDLANSWSLARSTVYGVAVDGNDVYVVGGVELPNGGYKAVYWKNSVENILAASNGYNAYGYRMILK